uniref:Laminin subunit alpha 3 n=1 Tax=Oreochromis niloticus TaxID=8128 RepID=A0A669EWG8_ORENI
MARGMRGAHLLFGFYILGLTLFRDADGQQTFNDLTGFSLNPPYFNLAQGSGITATATCGQDEAGTPRYDLYCKLVGGPTNGLLTQNIQGQFCDYCNSVDPNKAHPVTNAIDGTERWWQSPPLSMGVVYNEVNVTLDLGQLFHVAYVLIKFANSPRPDLWVLERSVDNGKTFTPWQYFAHSARECLERFGKQPNARLLNDDDQLCITEYSRIIPLENGEIVVSLVNGRPGAKNFTYSPALQDFTKATNIRLHFLRTNTLLGHLISKAQRDPTVTRRYYYSIKDISIGGRCVCHGHAQMCGVSSPFFSRQCECQHNTCGESCDRCCPGFNQKPWRAATVDNPNECQPCQCFSHAFDCYYDPEVEKRGTSLDTFGRFDGGGVCINCQHNTAGVNCERCIEGFYRPYGVPTESPTGCIPCRCDERTTAGCEMGSGRCICKPQFAGENCDRCADGHYYYPDCFRYPVYPATTKSPAGPIVGKITCICDYRGTLDGICDALGRCLCQQSVEGERCDRCRPGYHSFPNCRACRCSQEGSYDATCDPLSGQCLCLPGVVGQLCDRCASGVRFPQCSASISVCNTAGTEASDPRTGSCRCLANVEGTLCDRCKPLYWNLAVDNPRGCIECHCDLKGTLSGVGECEQKSGQCHCKPNTCGHACDSCKDGYFLLQKKNYYGCQGCQCDIGGAIGTACNDISGQCQCRKNIIGRKCTEPAPGYYFPTLHQLRFEVEDGTSPNSRPVRFGYSSQEFPDFSWRGYAVMSPAQTEVRVTVHVEPKDGRQHLFRVVLRFSNPSSTLSDIKAICARCSAGSEQSKEVIFPVSPSPSFLTVPGDGFAEPFELTPGTWIMHIRAEGVLLDYLVLLPQDYYEAPLLQEKITQPCTYLPTANKDENCLLYKHIALDGFSSALGSQGKFTTRRGRKRRQARVRRLTPDHPEMAALNGRQSQLQLSLLVPHSGPYMLILEYASEVDTVQNVNILISGQSVDPVMGRANIYSCAFSNLCRSVAVDNRNQVAVFQLSHRTEVLLQTSTASFLLYKVYAVPADEFSIEYVDPKVLCVSTHGRFTEDTWWKYLTALPPRHSVCAVLLFFFLYLPSPKDTHSGFLMFFFFSQTEISFTPNVPLPGRYVIIVHYHQPEHISFPVEVRVDAGREWKGMINASFCPAVSGCREVVIADGRIALDFERNPWQLPVISVRVPPRKTLILDYIMLVPDSVYTPELLREKPLDKSEDFIQQCREEGFYIDPRTSSQFCRDSARSLVAAYNDGALPCDCDASGSTGIVCDAVGGQCPCRPHVIGRQCTKCATGYFGFPYCRPCDCGRRLCDEVTGRCICPPQTVRPACDVCQNQTFSYHPLLGCENCECSPSGIAANAGAQCDRNTGQCSCKPRIGGRKCDRCAPGYYRFPDCVPCDCNQGGVTSNVCDPDTGRCLCKRNVAGVRCDTCRERSFYFDPSNPLGCTSCFCFGVTDQCQSSSKRRGKFVDMQGWRLESPDREEVTSVLNKASNTVVADIQELSPAVQTLHWVAPPSYLGNRISSYGGFLTYQSKSFGIPSEGMTPIGKRPDVVLTGHNMTLIHTSPQAPLPDRLYQGRVQLLEGNWRHAINNRPVSREELMMVLAGLVGLRIRALYFTQSQRLSLGEVGLEGATASGTGGSSNLVEKCSCPSQYTGDSCEKCQPGYYRDGSSPFLGLCVPCECNGLSDECEDRTGRCLNCRYNTAGDRCERCKDGYYGDAALRTCRACPCPFTTSTQNFAVGCREVYGNIECICRAGYAGSKCERCAPGYYGDPLIPGGSCRPCNCAGNGNSCDPRTGGKFSFNINCMCVWLCLLEDLLKQLENQDTRGDLPAGNFLKLLEDAKRMVNEMEEKNFTPELTAAKKESNEAKKLLDYIKNNVSKQCDENEAAADQIRGLLEGYEAKLKELDKALKDAADLVKNANAQNGLNAKTLGDLQEYEQLAAQLDGAKTDLTKKVNEISKAAAKKDIVEAAEDHAKNLEKIAKDIEEYNASGRTEVRNAKDAIEAYKNITDAINAAEAAAKEAKVAAESTLNNVTNQKLTEKAKELKSHSKDLLTEAEQTEKDLNDDIATKINEANSNLNGILDDVNRTENVYIFFSLTFLLFPVNNLLNTIPSLTNKISTVENLTSQISPISNISENIKMLKDLIEQARDAANRVTIPMNFQGDGHVELHPPKNLDDLKAYTAISLMLQRPPGRGDGKRRRRQATEDDLFVLYLGNRDSTKNYIGMFLRNNELYGVYKLNGVEYKMKTGAITRSGPEPATFDRVDLRRIYQDAEMILTKAITSNTDSKQIKNGKQGEESKDLLDLSADDIVFYVGGYPPPASLRYPNYTGCIEFFSLNDRAVSLYNFKREDNINKVTPCKRLINVKCTCLSLPIQKQYLFLFLVLHRPHFSLEVRTRSPEGMLFFAATRGGQSHLALYMSKGRIRLSVGKQKIFNREKYNDGKWHTVMFSLEKKKFRLVVDGIRAQDGQLTNAELSSMKQQFLSPVYLGSTPHSLHKELKGLPKHSVSGCVRNFKMNGAQMSNPTANHGAGPCFEGQTQRGAYFSGNGAHVVVNDSFVVGSSFELLFNIRPRSLTGLLLHVGVYSKNPNGLAMGHYLIIYMLEGEVFARVNNGNGEFMVSVKPKASLCDGVFHKISVIKRKNVVQLYVDTLDNYKIGPPFSNIPLTKHPLYVGGIPGKCKSSNLSD